MILKGAQTRVNFLHYMIVQMIKSRRNVDQLFVWKSYDVLYSHNKMMSKNSCPTLANDLTTCPGMALLSKY